MAICGCNFLKPPVVGSRQMAKETRILEDFDKFQVSGAADVEWAPLAGEAKCELQCDENLLGLIRTEVIDGQLVIAPVQSIRPSEGLKIRLSSEHLRQVEMAGACQITLTDLNEPALDIQGAGSSKVNCTGTVDALQLEFAGSSRCEAGQLSTRTTDIRIAGSGKAEVRVSDKLNVKVAGSGKVRYHGSPEVKQSISGSGKIEKISADESEPTSDPSVVTESSATN